MEATTPTRDPVAAASAQHRRMLERQEPLDFLDNQQEWRRIFAVTWGTFLLVVVAAAGALIRVRSGGTVTLGMAVVAPGLMVMVIIYSMGTVSGAHLNPAVTIAFALRRNFRWQRVPGYLAGSMVMFKATDETPYDSDLTIP